MRVEIKLADTSANFDDVAGVSSLYQPKMVCKVQGACLPSFIALPPSDLHSEGEHLQ